MPIHADILWHVIFTHKLGQTDLDYGVLWGENIGLCVHDYKSLCAAITVWFVPLWLTPVTLKSR